MSKGLRISSVAGATNAKCAKAISSATAQHEPRSASIAVQYFTAALATWDVILIPQRDLFEDMNSDSLRGLFLAVDRLCFGREMNQQTDSFGIVDWLYT